MRRMVAALTKAGARVGRRVVAARVLRGSRAKRVATPPKFAHFLADEGAPASFAGLGLAGYRSQPWSVSTASVMF